VPPLRERPQDIPRFIDYFLNIYRQRFNRPDLNISIETRRRLQDYAWPGNVRELRNCLERAAAISVSDIIDESQMSFLATQPTSIQSDSFESRATDGLPKTLEQLEREHILRVLDETAGNRERASAILGISSRTLYRKLREYETEANSTGLASEG
jgi:DNA-binding NtrC family response regulator